MTAASPALPARPVPVVVLDGAARTYPGPPPVEALRPVDLELRRGEYVAIMGPSGSGKSTLLNLLGLLDEPTSGRYRLEGHDLVGAGDRQRSSYRGHTIGVVFQAFHLLDDRPIVDNVALALLYRVGRAAERRRLAAEVLDRVGLDHRRDARPSTLSGGERQRVAIARALVAEPRLLLCDEPTGNLDQATAASILDLLDDLHRGKITVVVVTHDPTVAARADRILVMRDGQLGGAGSGGVASASPPAPSLPPPSRTTLSCRDAIGEATLSLLGRPRRSVLTGLGIFVGVVALVATFGLATTAANQIDARFDALAATEVVVEEQRADDEAAVADPGRPALPADAEARIRTLRGVSTAGILALPATDEVVSAHWPSSALAKATPLAVVGLSAGAFSVVEPLVARGRVFDEFHVRRADRVAVLGRSAATSLGLSDVASAPAVFVGDVPFTVIGIVDDVARHPELLLSVMVPESAVSAVWAGAPATRQLLVETEPGAAQLVAAQAPVALRPDRPDRLRVQAPPDPKTLRADVNRDVTTLFIGLGLVSIAAGTFGIAAIMSVAVLQRVSEIGIRRAVGARRRHIAAQFLAEGGVLGFLGGILGTAAGVVVVVAAAAARTWTAVIDPAVVAGAPVLGTVTGVVAGVLPACRAAAIRPVEALRR